MTLNCKQFSSGRKITATDDTWGLERLSLHQLFPKKASL